MNKKILVLIGSLTIGGAERHIANVFPRLAALGWQIEIMILMPEKGALSTYVENQGISVTPLVSIQVSQYLKRLPKWCRRVVNIICCIFSLARRLRKDDQCILHFFLPEAYLVGMFAVTIARFQGPTIMSRRSLNDYQQRRPILKWCEAIFRNKATVVTGNSQAVINQLNTEGFLKKKIKLIYNGIDISHDEKCIAKHEMRQNFQIPEEALVFIIVANLIPYKGHADLLAALHEVAKNLPEKWYLLCVGEDRGIGEQLKQQAERFNLSHHIQWLSGRLDVPDLLGMADIGLLCSHEEGFSNALLESMAAGLSMVVTDVGGNQEAVLDGQTGYVVEARNPQALARAILRLATDPKKIKQFGAAGRARVAEKFSMQTCITAYKNLYETLAE